MGTHTLWRAHCCSRQRPPFWCVCADVAMTFTHWRDARLSGLRMPNGYIWNKITTISFRRGRHACKCQSRIILITILREIWQSEHEVRLGGLKQAGHLGGSRGKTLSHLRLIIFLKLFYFNLLYDSSPCYFDPGSFYESILKQVIIGLLSLQATEHQGCLWIINSPHH